MVDESTHAKFSKEYNELWKGFITKDPDATPEEILNYARELAEKYGFKVNF